MIAFLCEVAESAAMVVAKKTVSPPPPPPLIFTFLFIVSFFYLYHSFFKLFKEPINDSSLVIDNRSRNPKEA